MSQRRFLGYTQRGADEWFEYDEGTNQAIIHTHADVTPIIDLNKQRQNDGTQGWLPGRTERLIADIPVELIPILNKQYGTNVLKDMKLLRRILNDPDLKYLRTY